MGVKSNRPIAKGRAEQIGIHRPRDHARNATNDNLLRHLMD